MIGYVMALLSDDEKFKEIEKETAPLVEKDKRFKEAKEHFNVMKSCFED